MANGLTYVSLCCVLEYLEANARFHIVSRSPKLQKFEKSIPLRLEHLCIQEDCTEINDVLYLIQKNYEVDENQSNNLTCDEELEPGDLMIGDNKVYFLELNVNKFPEMTIPIRQKLKFREAVKNLNCYWLGGRREIYVDHVQIGANVREVLRLPVNLQLKTRKLNSRVNDFRVFLPIISPGSFPLKKLRTETRTEDILNHVSLKSAERLVLYMMDERMPDWFLEHYQEELVNKDVTIYNGRFEKEEAIRIVKRIIKYRREVGRCFRMKRITVDRCIDFARAINSEFDVRKLDDHCYIRINDSLRLVYYRYERGNGPLVNIQFEMELVDEDQLSDDIPKVSGPILAVHPPEPMLSPVQENRQRWKIILMICIPVLVLLIVNFFGY